MARFRAYAAAPSEAERAALVEEFSWVARHCARRFADRGEPFDDLLQVGMLGVLKAVDRFDPEHGTSFVSFALPTVLGELRRHFRDTTWAVRVPRRLKDLHVEVGATIEFLNTENGPGPRRPTQVADHLGIPVEDVLEALDAGAAYRSSPLNVSGERDDDDGPSPVSPRWPRPRPRLRRRSGDAAPGDGDAAGPRAADPRAALRRGRCRRARSPR